MDPKTVIHEPMVTIPLWLVINPARLILDKIDFTNCYFESNAEHLSRDNNNERYNVLRYDT